MISTASLFCGGGGEMAGKRLAFEELGIPVEQCDNLAVNHWDIAVLASRRNFPLHRVMQEDITQISADQLGITHLDMLWASPSCVHFSVARGGVPCSDQQRSHADEVIDRWLARADVPVFLLENVKEFRTWGPLLTANTIIKGKRHKAGRPDPRRKGEFFVRFCNRLKALGYTVDDRVLCAADYGDATSRRRLFLQAVKDGNIRWPEPTHGGPGQPVHRSAAEVIDWSDLGSSIFGRKKPLAGNSLKRIKYGLKNHGLRPFLNYLTHTKSTMPTCDIGKPVPTVTTAKGGELALALPFLMHATHDGQRPVHAVEKPMATITGANRGELALVQPVIIKNFGGGCTNPAAPISDPMPTVTARDHNALIQPCLMELRGTADDQLKATSRAVTEPIATVTAGGGHHALLQPYLIEYHNGSDGERRVRSLGNQLPTADTQNRFSLVRPFLCEYYGTALATSVDEPLLTATTKARHALVQLVLRLGGPEALPLVRCEADLDALDLSTPFLIEIEGVQYIVDVLYRMLRPRELARAMGFPDWYKFETPDGKPMTTTDIVKLIGNACPVNTVKELIKAAILARPATFGLAAA